METITAAEAFARFPEAVKQTYELEGGQVASGDLDGEEFWEENPNASFEEWLATEDERTDYAVEGNRLYMMLSGGPSDAWEVYTPGIGWRGAEEEEDAS